MKQAQQTTVAKKMHLDTGPQASIENQLEWAQGMTAGYIATAEATITQMLEEELQAQQALQKASVGETADSAKAGVAGNQAAVDGSVAGVVVMGAAAGYAGMKGVSHEAECNELDKQIKTQKSGIDDADSRLDRLDGDDAPARLSDSRAGAERDASDDNKDVLNRKRDRHTAERKKLEAKLADKRAKFGQSASMILSAGGQVLPGVANADGQFKKSCYDGQQQEAQQATQLFNSSAGAIGQGVGSLVDSAGRLLSIDANAVSSRA